MNKRLSLTYRMKTILIRLKKVEWYINQTVYTVGGNWDMKKTGIILGALLFLPQLIHFINLKGNIPLIIINAVLLIIPYYYLHSAYKNFKQS